MKFSKEDLKAGKHMEARKELGRQLSKIRMRDGPYHNSGVYSVLHKHSFISLEAMVTSLVNIHIGRNHLINTKFTKPIAKFSRHTSD